MPIRVYYAVRRRIPVERYPTRTVEHFLAWFILLWSYAALKPGAMLTGPAFVYLLKIAPEYVWGGIGVVLAIGRIVALFVNGRWVRTPTLRLLGAATGFSWWLTLSFCYWRAVDHGASDFPMRYGILALLGAEMYSAFRCGQDREAARLQEAARKLQIAGNGV